jgi:hypothetical protein
MFCSTTKEDDMSRRRAIAALTTLALVGAVPAVSSAATPVAHVAKTAPNVHCVRLDKAKKRLYQAGFDVKVKGGGLFGVVVDADWVVTSQSTHGNTVTVYAGRRC